jgi:uncharacterized protein (DUF305 family)
VKRLIALFAALAIALTGCATGDPAKTFSSDDTMFAGMMIVHHKQAVEMSTLAENRTENPVIKHFASHIKAAQAPEITLMQGWLDTSGSDGHWMHYGMPGLLSEDQMNDLRIASGKEFDVLFLQGMIAHHEGAVSMAEAVKDSANPEVRKLAASIIKSQTAEIADMKSALENL